MERLVREGVRFRFTMSLTPTLLAMLEDELLRVRYLRFLDSHIELANKEAGRTWEEAREYHNLALMYRANLLHCRGVFQEQYDTFLARG